MLGIFNIRLLLFCLCGIMISCDAYATLGGHPDSIESDRHALSAVKRTARPDTYFTVHEMESPSNTVREYVSPSGVVFAVAWNGLTQPDLTQLLGSYTDMYKEALRETPRQYGVRRLRVKGADVVVETWGHTRNLRGRAYAPSLIPSGVSLDEIK